MLFLQTFMVAAGQIALWYLITEQNINKTICDNIGGPGTFEKFAVLETEGPDCFEKQEMVKRDKYSKFADEDQIGEFLQLTCSKQYTIEKCYKPKIFAAKQCLNKTEITALEKWENIDVGLVSYMCKNQDKMRSYFEGLNERCLDIGIIKLREKCLKWEQPTFHDFTKMSCMQYEELEKCVVDNISHRCSKDVTDVITSIIKIVKDNTCNSRPKLLQRSTRSLHRFVRQLPATADKMFRIEGRAKSLCVTNGHESKKLEDTLEKMKSCIKEKELFMVTKREYIQHIDNCTKDAIALFKSCLPEKYKFLPHLLFNILDSMVSFLYDDFTLITSVLSPCLDQLKGEESAKEYNGCIDKVTNNIGDDDLVDSKEKFCERFILLNHCFITQIQKQCKPSPERTKFEDDFMKAVKRPCENK